LFGDEAPLGVEDEKKTTDVVMVEDTSKWWTELFNIGHNFLAYRLSRNLDSWMILKQSIP
jgi:hypothetical protein